MTQTSRTYSRYEALLELKGRAAEQAWVDAISTANADELADALRHLATWVRIARGGWPVVDALSNRPTNPHIAHFALDCLENAAELRHTSGKLMRRLLECVERHGDSPCAPRVRALGPRSRPGDVLADLRPDRIERVAQRLERAQGPRTRPHSGARRDAATFLEAIRTNPSDHSLRAVFTDWLMTQSPERAEFVRLQLEGSLREGALKKMHALQRRHQREWLGGLWPLLEKNRTGTWGPVIFRKGLLHEVTLGRISGRPKSSWTAPELATVEIIRFSAEAWKVAAAAPLTFPCLTVHLQSNDVRVLEFHPNLPRLTRFELSAVATNQTLAAASTLGADTLCFLPPAGGRWAGETPWTWDALDATSARCVELHLDGQEAVATLTRTTKHFDVLHVRAPLWHQVHRVSSWLRERTPRRFKACSTDGPRELAALFEP